LLDAPLEIFGHDWIRDLEPPVDMTVRLSERYIVFTVGTLFLSVLTVVAKREAVVWTFAPLALPEHVQIYPRLLTDVASSSERSAVQLRRPSGKEDTKLRPKLMQGLIKKDLQAFREKIVAI
jgi:hypothetical protein